MVRGGVLRPIDMRDPGEIERAVVAFARVPNSGLIVVGSPSGTVHRNLIITLRRFRSGRIRNSPTNILPRCLRMVARHG